MTYILTEIALGIFGHKFYDIDGVPGSLSLHEQSYEQEEDFSNEPNLVQWLESDEETADDEDSNDIEIDDDAMDLEIKDSAANKSSLKKLAANKEFNKLLNHERAKLREQIRRNSAAYLLNWPSNTKNTKSLKSAEEALISDFKKSELALLQQELDILTEFRKNAEQKVNDIDPQIFEQYKNTFMSTSEISC